MRQDIDQQEWEELLANDKNAVILDVRTPGEIEEGYIAKMEHYDFFEVRNFWRL